MDIQKTEKPLRPKTLEECWELIGKLVNHHQKTSKGEIKKPNTRPPENLGLYWHIA